MNGPHQEQPLARAGRRRSRRPAAMVMVHGRGRHGGEHPGAAARIRDTRSSPTSRRRRRGTPGIPYSFMAPMERNEPGLSSALARLGEVLAGAGGRGDSAASARSSSASPRGPACRWSSRPATPGATPAVVGALRRADRPAGHAAGLPGIVRRHAGLPRLQRPRSAHPARAGGRVRGGAAADGSRGDGADLSGDGAYGERGRDGVRAGAGGGGGVGPHRPRRSRDFVGAALCGRPVRRSHLPQGASLFGRPHPHPGRPHRAAPTFTASPPRPSPPAFRRAVLHILLQPVIALREPVQHRLAAAVAVGFQRQEDQAGRGAVPLEGVEEALALDRDRCRGCCPPGRGSAGRVLDLVRVHERGHLSCRPPARARGRAPRPGSRRA